MMMRNYDEIIALVDSFALLHDPNTNGHGARTAKLARKMAKNMGLKKGDIDIINFSMHIHDVGKITIAESILNKATRLTQAEKGMIKSHTALGVEVLKPLKLDVRIYQIIGQHHENFDGSGYPLGLKGNAISILARIARVVDYYDAMTNFRAYREIYSTQHALIEMKKDNGIAFDPEVYKAFAHMILMEYS